MVVEVLHIFANFINFYYNNIYTFACENAFPPNLQSVQFLSEIMQTHAEFRLKNIILIWRANSDCVRIFALS